DNPRLYRGFEPNLHSAIQRVIESRKLADLDQPRLPHDQPGGNGHGQFRGRRKILPARNSAIALTDMILKLNNSGADAASLIRSFRFTRSGLMRSICRPAIILAVLL